MHTPSSSFLAPTPLVHVPELGLWLKDERAQPTGSFKVRGALRWVQTVRGGSRVVTGSSGNHAKALAWALDATGDPRPLTVVVTHEADPAKVRALEALGATVEVCTGDNSLRDVLAQQIAKECGGRYCSSSDDVAVIAGQASLVREVYEQLPSVHTVIVPVGGGGLLAGSLSAAETLPIPVEVIGAEPEGAASMAESLALGIRVRLERASTVCDALRAVTPSRRCFEIALAVGAEIVRIDDTATLRAAVRLADLVGPVDVASAISVAAAKHLEIRGAVCVLTGTRASAGEAKRSAAASFASWV